MASMSKIVCAALAALCVGSASAACGAPGSGGGGGGSKRRTSPRTTLPSTPVTKPTSSIVPSLIAAVGYKSFCMVVAGEVRCWGDDANGVLGYTHDQASDYLSFYENSTSYAYSTVDFTCNVDSDPAMVPAVPFGPNHSRAVEVVGSPTAGGACARFENGGVKCWGEGNNGLIGQGSSLSFLPVEDIPTMPYIQFANSSSGRPTLAAQLVSSDHHRCILSTEHEVHCWGRNIDGVLGVGDLLATGTSTRSVAAAGAVPLWGEGKTKPVQVAVSNSNTCVLMNDGTMGCWGDQSNHRDGTSATSGRIGNQPNEVCNIEALDFENSDAHVVSIHGAVLHMCAVLSDGTSTCWGYNGYGSMGRDSNQLLKHVDDERIVVTPTGTDYAPINTTVAMAVGRYVTCAIGRAGGAAQPGLKCWGQGSPGLLAQNNTQNYGVPIRTVAMADFINFGAQAPGFAPRQVAMGVQSACALLAARDLTGAARLNETVRALEENEAFAVRCWGRNRGCALGVEGSNSAARIGLSATSAVATWQNAFDFEGIALPAPVPMQDDTTVPTAPSPPTNNNNDDNDAAADADVDDAAADGQEPDDGAAGGAGGVAASDSGAPDDGSMGDAALAGIIVGAVVAVAVVAGVVLWKRGAFAASTPPAAPTTVGSSSAAAVPAVAGEAGTAISDEGNFARNNPMTTPTAASSVAQTDFQSLGDSSSVQGNVFSDKHE